jgi:hypothetical protein
MISALVTKGKDFTLTGIEGQVKRQAQMISYWAPAIVISGLISGLKMILSSSPNSESLSYETNHVSSWLKIIMDSQWLWYTGPIP